jgi:DNA polymerase III subunit epsilon
MIQLTKPLAFLDIESTGVDVVKDRIIELAVVVLNPDGSRKPWLQRFNPGIPIPAEATAVHGITDADVAGEPPFADHARRIWAALRGKDLAGYNLARFDLALLDQEFRRCGLKLDLSGVAVVDCFGIFSKKEPRKLEDAVRRYCGREHAGAHGAAADAEASLDVFLGQLEAYTDLGETVPAVAAYSRISERELVDLAGKLYRDSDGDLCFTFGKHREQKVRLHRNYAAWMLDQNFPGSTVDALRDELRRLEVAA